MDKQPKNGWLIRSSQAVPQGGERVYRVRPILNRDNIMTSSGQSTRPPKLNRGFNGAEVDGRHGRIPRALPGCHKFFLNRKQSDGLLREVVTTVLYTVLAKESERSLPESNMGRDPTQFNNPSSTCQAMQHSTLTESL